MYMPSLPAANCAWSFPHARPCVALMALSVNRSVCSAVRIARPLALSKAAVGGAVLALTVVPPSVVGERRPDVARSCGYSSASMTWAPLICNVA